MIDSVVNLVFRCRHKHLTRPLTPVSRSDQPHAESYVACLDCGKHFSYDTREMRIGKPLPRVVVNRYSDVDDRTKQVRI